MVRFRIAGVVLNSLFTLLFATGCSAAPVEVVAPSYPKCILIIRHAEKPPPEKMSVHLTDEGMKRAEALAGLFEKSDARPEPFPKPDFVFASKNTSRSHRPKETVAPFAKSIELKVNHQFDDEDVDGFAKHLLNTPKYAGKTLLVSWHHSTTPPLAKKLGIAAPPKWHDSAFDRVWEITFDEEGKATLKDRPQRLMPGDAKK